MNLTAHALARLSPEESNNAGRGSRFSERHWPQIARPGRVRTAQVVQWLSLLTAVAALTLALNGALVSRWQQVVGASQPAVVPVRGPDSFSETSNARAPGAR